MKWILFCLPFLMGCQMTCGIYLQKDWKTEPCYPVPDMHTQAKIEMVKDWK